MSRLTRHIWFKIVAIALIVSFIYLDITWAHPIDQYASGTTATLGTSLLSAPAPATPKSAEHQLIVRVDVYVQTVLATLRREIFESGKRSYKINDLVNAVSARFAKSPRSVEELGFDLNRVWGVRWDEVNKSYNYFNENEFLPDDAIIIVPYQPKRDGELFIIQIARKGTGGERNLIGEVLPEWESEVYSARYVWRGYKSKGDVETEKKYAVLAEVPVRVERPQAPVTIKVPDEPSAAVQSASARQGSDGIARVIKNKDGMTVEETRESYTRLKSEADTASGQSRLALVPAVSGVELVVLSPFADIQNGLSDLVPSIGAKDIFAACLLAAYFLPPIIRSIREWMRSRNAPTENFGGLSLKTLDRILPRIKGKSIFIEYDPSSEPFGSYGYRIETFIKDELIKRYGAKLVDDKEHAYIVITAQHRNIDGRDRFDIYATRPGTKISSHQYTYGAEWVLLAMLRAIAGCVTRGSSLRAIAGRILRIGRGPNPFRAIGLIAGTALFASTSAFAETSTGARFICLFNSCAQSPFQTCFVVFGIFILLCYLCSPAIQMPLSEKEAELSDAAHPPAPALVAPVDSCASEELPLPEIIKRIKKRQRSLSAQKYPTATEVLTAALEEIPVGMGGLRDILAEALPLAEGCGNVGFPVGFFYKSMLKHHFDVNMARAIGLAILGEANNDEINRILFDVYKATEGDAKYSLIGALNLLKQCFMLWGDELSREGLFAFVYEAMPENCVNIREALDELKPICQDEDASYEAVVAEIKRIVDIYKLSDDHAIPLYLAFFGIRGVQAVAQGDNVKDTRNRVGSYAWYLQHGGKMFNSLAIFALASLAMSTAWSQTEKEVFQPWFSSISPEAFILCAIAVVILIFGWFILQSINIGAAKLGARERIATRERASRSGKRLNLLGILAGASMFFMDSAQAQGVDTRSLAALPWLHIIIGTELALIFMLMVIRSCALAAVGKSRNVLSDENAGWAVRAFFLALATSAFVDMCVGTSIEQFLFLSPLFILYMAAFSIAAVLIGSGVGNMIGKKIAVQVASFKSGARFLGCINRYHNRIQIERHMRSLLADVGQDNSDRASPHYRWLRIRAEHDPEVMAVLKKWEKRVWGDWQRARVSYIMWLIRYDLRECAPRSATLSSTHSSGGIAAKRVRRRAPRAVGTAPTAPVAVVAVPPEQSPAAGKPIVIEPAPKEPVVGLKPSISPYAGGADIAAISDHHDRVKQLYTIIESRRNNRRSSSIAAINSILRSIKNSAQGESVDTGPVDDNMLTTALRARIKEVLVQADRMGAAAFQEKVRDGLAFLMENKDRLEADSIITSIFVLSVLADLDDHKKFIFGIETDWVPGMNKSSGYGTQRQAMDPILQKINQLKAILKEHGRDNIEIINEDGGEIARIVESAVADEKAMYRNVVIFASEQTINQKFGYVRGLAPNNRPFLASVAEESIDALSAKYRARKTDEVLDIQLAMMLSIVVEHAVGERVFASNWQGEFKYDPNNWIALEFFPSAKLIPYGELKNRNDNDATFLESA